MSTKSNRSLVDLLGSFSPIEWEEKSYIRSPPYRLETTGGGRLLLAPSDTSTEAVLDKLSRSLGLTKRKQIPISFIVNRTESAKVLRTFDWFVRRSWQDKRFSVLWALIYVGEAKGWSRPKISLDSIAEMTNCDPKFCNDIMTEILDGEITHSEETNSVNFDLNRMRVEASLSKFVEELPTWTEEQVMKSLCSGMGASVEEVYDQITALGFGMAAAYKIIERLKKSGFVYASRHFRVKERGPMREQLAANCRSCFYGYSSEDNCLLDILRQIESLLEEQYDRKITDEERRALFNSIKMIPFSSHVSRRALESLGLIHQVELMTNERRVLKVLEKIEDGYGVDFPIRTKGDKEDTNTSAIS